MVVVVLLVGADTNVVTGQGGRGDWMTIIIIIIIIIAFTGTKN